MKIHTKINAMFFFALLALLSVNTVAMTTTKLEYTKGFSVNECNFVNGYATEAYCTHKSESNSMNLFQRFDILVRTLSVWEDLPHFSFEDYIRKCHYDPHATKWHGICDLTAEASLDPSIQQALHKIDDDIVFEIEDQIIVLTKADIRDLFMFLYPRDRGGVSHFFGARSFSEDKTAVSPVLFHEAILDNLSKDGSVVADISSNHEIHNRVIRSIHTNYPYKRVGEAKSSKITTVIEFFDEVPLGIYEDKISSLNLRCTVEKDEQGNLTAFWKEPPPIAFLWKPAAPFRNLSDKKLSKTINSINQLGPKIYQRSNLEIVKKVGTELIFRLLAEHRKNNHKRKFKFLKGLLHL